jgi:hypothetical protein
MYPTPAAARYIKHGLPRPPAPTTRTDAFLISVCPFIPTSPKTRCLEYRDISSLVSLSLVVIPNFIIVFEDLTRRRVVKPSVLEDKDITNEIRRKCNSILRMKCIYD